MRFNAIANNPFLDFFTPLAALALLLGTVITQTLSALPPHAVDAFVGIAGILLSMLRNRWRYVGFVLLGLAWTMWRADLALAQRLPANLESEDVIVTGTIVGLPRALDDSTHFDLRVTTAERDGQPITLTGTVRISWHENAPFLAPCSHWRLLARLKRPRGLIDPGGFDFERYALEQGITATGYVREDIANKTTGDDVICIDRLRLRIVENIIKVLGSDPSADLLRALAFGDQHAMDEHEWAVARATGIPHLIAISGLHIALFASFGVALVRLVWKLAPRLTLRWPAPLIEAAASLLFAVGYALIAGFGLPTQRALIMIAALLIANFARRARAPVQGLVLAVIGLLVWNPLCVLSAGFWLSFIGVAWLMFCLRGPVERHRWWREMVHAQAVASLGLLPLGIWFFGQSSLIGPLANLFAVPCICFFILPLTVCASLVVLVAPVFGASMLQVAGWAMQSLWWLLEQMASLPGALWYFPEPSALSLGLALLGAFWLLSPRGLPARGLGPFLMLPLLWPSTIPLADGEFETYMLDVGQGLSFVVRTRDHVIVYDAGARYPSGFDLGNSTVVPALHALGITHLDRMVISHGDNDHAGGAAAVLAAYPSTEVETGEPERVKFPAKQCLAGESWIWNDVSFRLVHPHVPLSEHDNDRCCVLDVRNGKSELVLTGDITSAVEADIAGALGSANSQLVLQVPHHGSKTSSTENFLQALRPTWALVSAGYRNHFNHPNPDVVARYAAEHIEMLNSAQTGFVDMRFSADAPPQIIERGRANRHPYWRE